MNQIKFFFFTSTHSIFQLDNYKDSFHSRLIVNELLTAYSKPLVVDMRIISKETSYALQDRNGERGKMDQ